MKLIIAEKRNVATAIATAIDGAQETKDGYVKKGDLVVITNDFQKINNDGNIWVCDTDSFVSAKTNRHLVMLKGF